MEDPVSAWLTTSRNNPLFVAGLTHAGGLFVTEVGTAEALIRQGGIVRNIDKVGQRHKGGTARPSQRANEYRKALI